MEKRNNGALIRLRATGVVFWIGQNTFLTHPMPPSHSLGPSRQRKARIPSRAAGDDLAFGHNRQTGGAQADGFGRGAGIQNHEGGIGANLQAIVR